MLVMDFRVLTGSSEIPNTDGVTSSTTVGGPDKTGMLLVFVSLGALPHDTLGTYDLGGEAENPSAPGLAVGLAMTLAGGNGAKSCSISAPFRVLRELKMLVS